MPHSEERNSFSVYEGVLLSAYIYGRLSFANGIDATHKDELYLRRVLH